MDGFIERLAIEQADLHEKVKNLKAFIGTDVYEKKAIWKA